jgi:transcriptional regulator with XRE-family HTH domain
MRAKKRWSRAELARRLGTTRTRLLRWERGSIPSLDKLILLSQVFETTLDLLLAGRRIDDGLTPEQKEAAVRHLNHLAGLLRLKAHK